VIVSCAQRKKQQCYMYTITYGCTSFTSDVNVLNEITVRTECIQITINFIMSYMSLVNIVFMKTWHK